MNPRTCLVSNQVTATERLLRFTVQEGQLVFDRDQKNSGRGGYIKKDPDLIKKLPKLSGKINYKLGLKGKLEISESELAWALNQC